MARMASPRVERRGDFDISLDFLFYAPVPFGFIIADPAQNAVAGGWLLFSLSEPAAVFAFAALAAKHQIANPGYAHKSFYYLGIDGGE